MVRQHAFLMPVLFIAHVCLTTTGQTPLAQPGQSATAIFRTAASMLILSAGDHGFELSILSLIEVRHGSG